MPLSKSTLSSGTTDGFSSIDWPEGYFNSAEQFVHLARCCGAQAESRHIEARGPENEILRIDVAAFISPDDDYRVIIVSGVHGVEGFLGAAVQMQFMKRLAEGQLPAKTGVVLIHAANPWGYAHSRRADENNIDVNRNFSLNSAVAECASSASHLQYAELDPVINASQSPTMRGEIVHWLKAGRLIVRAGGIKPLFGPIAQGQYDFPQGLFYGGSCTGESCEHLQTLVKQYTFNANRVSVLDVHSGLGPCAVATLIGHCNYTGPGKSLRWLETQLGQEIVSDNDDGNTYNAKGTFARWFYSEMNRKKIVYLCIEIGTVNPIKVFSALRRENQAHHWSSPDSNVFIQTKQALREVFSPSSVRWRRKSIRQALGVIEKIINLPIEKAR